MSNREEFDEFVVEILGKLYESFPQAVTLRIEEFEQDCTQNTLMNFAHTVEFLAEEGFISIGDGSDEGHFFTYSKLTMKGLNALNAVPEFFEEKLPWGNRFAAGESEGITKEVLRASVSEFLKVQS